MTRVMNVAAAGWAARTRWRLEPGLRCSVDMLGDSSVLHDERHAAQRFDIVERIIPGGDDIGHLPRLQSSQVLVEAHHGRSANRRRLNRRKRREAGLADHYLELLHVVA